MKQKLLIGFLMSFLSLSCFAETPTALDAFLQKGETLWLAGDLTQAQQQFEQAVQHYPKNATAHSKLAGFFLVQNDYQNSIKHYQQSISLQTDAAPERTKAFIGLGLAYLHSERSKLAIAALEEALRLEPQRQTQLNPLINKLRDKNDNQ